MRALYKVHIDNGCSSTCNNSRKALIPYFQSLIFYSYTFSSPSSLKFSIALFAYSVSTLCLQRISQGILAKGAFMMVFQRVGKVSIVSNHIQNVKKRNLLVNLANSTFKRTAIIAHSPYIKRKISFFTIKLTISFSVFVKCVLSLLLAFCLVVAFSLAGSELVKKCLKRASLVYGSLLAQQDTV